MEDKTEDKAEKQYIPGKGLRNRRRPTFTHRQKEVFGVLPRTGCSLLSCPGRDEFIVMPKTGSLFCLAQDVGGGGGGGGIGKNSSKAEEESDV